MTTRIPADHALASYRMNLTGDPDPFFITMGWSLVAGTIPTDPLAFNILEAFRAAMPAQFSANIILAGGNVRFGPNPIGPTFERVFNTPGTQGATANLPPNCAILVQKRSAFGGRRNRGRFFLPGVAEVNVTDLGDLTDAYRTATQARIETWIAATGDIPQVLNPVILHNDVDKNGQPINDPPTVIQSVPVQSRIGTQRRRLR